MDPLGNITEYHSKLTEDELLQQAFREKVILLLPLTIYKWIIIICGIPGNSLVCYVYRPKPDMSSLTFFMFFIGLVDLISCVILVPFEVVSFIYQHRYEFDHLCRISGALTIWLGLSMAFAVLAVSFERYRMIRKSSEWQVTLRQANIVCIIITIGSFSCAVCVGIPIFNMRGISYSVHKKYNITVSKCTYQHSDAGTDTFKFWYIMSGFILFIGGLIGILVLNYLTASFMYKKINKQRRSIFSNCVALCRKRKVSRTQRTVMSRSLKISLSMLFVSLAFVISYLPVLAFLVVRNFNNDFEANLTDSETVAYMFGLNSFLVNNAINPFIYIMCHKYFRNNCKELFQGICSKCSNKLRNRYSIQESKNDPQTGGEHLEQKNPETKSEEQETTI